MTTPLPEKQHQMGGKGHSDEAMQAYAAQARADLEAAIERKDALLRQALDALRQCEFTTPPAQRKIVKNALAAITKELQ